MNLFEAIVLGLVQGLTEFLPISSSAHIRIVGEWLGVVDPGATFTAIIQIGTELAVIVYFWKKIVRIVARWIGSLRGTVPRSDPDARMGWFVIIGSIPIVLAGVLFQDLIRDQFRSLWIIASTLIGFGIILGVADVIGRQTKPLAALTLRDGILYGLAQMLALIPGVSRSGGTITAGRLLGYSRADATEYAFLLAIPAVLGSGVFELYNALTETQGASTPWGPTAIATVISFVSGFLVVKYLMAWISKHSYLPFVLYRIALGTLLMVLLVFGVMQP